MQVTADTPPARSSGCPAVGDAIRALVAAGAKTEAINSQGLTPLGVAVASNNAVAVAALLQCGAKGGALARGCVRVRGFWGGMEV